MFLVICNKCHAHVFTENGADVDLELKCSCCPYAHHHGQSADATGTICRPITISTVPGSIHVKAE